MVKRPRVDVLEQVGEDDESPVAADGEYFDEAMRLGPSEALAGGAVTASRPTLPSCSRKRSSRVGGTSFTSMRVRRSAAASPDLKPRLRQARDDLAAQTRIDVNDVPPTLLDRFRERDGSVGRLAVVTAPPAAHLELGPNLIAFVEGVRDVPVDGKRYDATGDNVVFADLLKNIEHEGPLTTAGSLLGVCVLVLVFFRNFRQSAEVVTALVTGIVLMGGAAALLHLKINFFNFIVFPITFGIAVDYGANIVVRVRERGGDVLGALAEVGPAVALCSWTSIVGYATLLIALNRALRSFGWYAVVGEITSITTALVMLPALSLWRRRDPISVDHGHARLLT